jgi:hypothetical protein
MSLTREIAYLTRLGAVSPIQVACNHDTVLVVVDPRDVSTPAEQDRLDALLRGFELVIPLRRDGIRKYLLEVSQEDRMRRVGRVLGSLGEKIEGYKITEGDEVMVYVTYREEGRAEFLTLIEEVLPELKDVGDYPYDSRIVQTFGVRSGPGPGLQDRMFMLRTGGDFQSV